MTSCGPYSQATLMYEPVQQQQQQRILAAVASPGTILDAIGKKFPETLKLIERAGLTRLYDSNIEEYQITFFVSREYAFHSCTPIARAIQTCKASTIPLRLHCETLQSSPLFVLKTLSAENDLIVSNIGSAKLTLVNSHPILSTIPCSNGNIFVLDRVLWNTLS